ncbi:dTDP-4-dehydrorhamnose reductase [Mucilaginibacter auburnensis]|uniref:dTDP-4-dehydrorhamnose reductase n=1 Tax=Mucilaginibacter auburnensis TaxID=1457233 RepID=A0A2H9VTF4_9SPHI|nr:dTDP-4-dehydrorhamnose reductase [Mucilaginibacter auburnensis]PJJ84084.1 dTDP-4-dehydrorhamnose reductase [Mucilaginibacter auburnensis]
MSKVVVFGANGQLGTCIKMLNGDNNLIYFPHEAEANILDVEVLTKVFAEQQPSYVINCAAYTAVDKAEDEVELAERVNVIGVKNLAEQCGQHGAVLIHVSTDFVFKGDVARPLTEADKAEPISVYGQTKLDGEKAAAAIEKHFVIRTGWLYSEHGNNFVKTMLRLGAERDEVRIIADQVGTPTYAIDLAAFILEIINRDSQAYGVYHYSNEGVTSWFDFARAVFDISETQVKAIPIRTDQYPTKATRPLYSVMDKSKVKETFSIEIPYWRDSLIKCITKLQQ